MPILTQDEAKTQSEMLTEGLEVHDRECCTADKPCTMRQGMTKVLDDIRSKRATRSPRVSAPATPVRQGNGNGSGKAKATRSSLASEAQQNMIRKLAAVKNITRYLDQDLEEFLAWMKKSEVDEAREFMLSQPWPDSKPAAKVAPVARVEVVEGMYLKGGVVYKVQCAVHGSGRLYAKKLVQDGADWSFEYAPNAIRDLTPADRMTAEDAKEFGDLYGICCRCAATLTDEESIARGLGPVCASKI